MVGAAGILPGPLARVGAAGPPASPVISRGVPAFASSELYPAARAADADYSTYWAGTPAAWLAYDLSSVPPQHRGVVDIAWYNDQTGNYDYSLAGAVAYNEPRDYTLEAAFGPAAGAPPATGWTVLAQIAGNVLHSRQHLVDLAGRNWVRINVTAVNGSQGNSDVALNLDIHDASAGLDSWIFYGDSLTEAALSHLESGSSNFAQAVARAAPAYFPAYENGGVGGLQSADGAAHIGDWLKLFPGRYVAIGYGTNDALQGVPADRFYSNVGTIVQTTLRAGKIPILATVPWGAAPNIQSYAPLLNAQLPRLVDAYPGTLLAPDFWSFFQSHQDLISADGIHPTTPAGMDAYRSLWATWAGSRIYGGVPAPTPSPSATPIPGPPPAAEAVVPKRLIDTRVDGIQLQPRGTIEVQVADALRRRPADIAAAYMNVTVTGPLAAGYLSALPAGSAGSSQGTVSSLNFEPGQTVANLVVSGLGQLGGQAGKVAIFNGSAGAVDVVVDLMAWAGAGSNLLPGARYQPLTPVRLLDTRTSLPVPGGGSVPVRVAGRPGLPAGGVVAAVVNVTATDPGAAGYLTVYPAPPVPLASNLNFGPGQTVPNRAVTALDPAGAFLVYNGAPGPTHVVVDLEGWFGDPVAPAPGTVFKPVAPVRVADTRGAGTLAPGGVLRLPFAGVAPPGAQAVVLDVTITNPAASGYLTAHPSGTRPPPTSDLNFEPGQTAANLVVCPLGADLGVEILNASAGNVDIVVDLYGWYG